MSEESDSMTGIEAGAPVGIRRQTMFEKVKDNVIGAILSAVIIGVGLSIWEIVSGGGLVGTL